MLRNHRPQFCRKLLIAGALIAAGTTLAEGGTFTPFGPQDYKRETGAPVTVTTNFSVLNPNTQYTLKAFNGGLQDDTTELVSSGVVTLNGVQVLGPSNFNQNVTEIDVPVTLQSSNALSVQVRGKPGGVLTIEVIGVDNDPPTIKAMVSPAPNAAGWNNTSVTVSFTCSDATSGVAICPPPRTLSTDGANQVVSGTATDKAGNTASTSVTVNLDQTPPTIAATASPSPNAASWNNTPVTVSFVCNDATSGVATCPPARTVTIDGGNQVITGTATDVAGNTASASVTVNLDQTPPTIAAAVSPSPNAAGWNNSNVTVTFTCNDATSGIANCPSPQTLTNDGPLQVVAGTATDKAGNTASASVTVNLDKTPPTITASAFPPPNAAGWNNTPVTVAFVCSDPTSGVLSCPKNQTVTVDGGNQVVSGTATDVAGNTANASATVNLDQTPPTITASVSPAPNAAGWNNTNVTVTFTCSDATSGIANCPLPQTVSTEGVKQLGGITSDKAGNTASTTLTVKLDKTPPTISIASPPNGSTISLSTISIGLNGSESDNLSGVSGVSCNGAPALISGSTFTCTVLLTQGPNSISVQATDAAGNVSSSPLALTYAPAPQVAITSPANLSITNLSPATVNGTVSDPAATVTVNGIPAPQSGGGFSIPVPLVEGLNVLAAVATNASGVASTATVQVTLDTTPPHITVDSPADGTTTTAAAVTVTGLANDVVVGTVNALDVQVTVNGIAAQVANRSYSAAGVPLALGKNTIQANARDHAGNSSSTSVTVTRVLPSQPPAPAIGTAVITQSLSIVSGNNQTGTIGTQLAQPLLVALTDSASNPVANQTVVFKVTGSNGTVSASGSGTSSSAVAVTTDSTGQAQVLWTLGTRAGAGINTVQASSSLAIGPASFTAIGLTANPFRIVVDSGNDQTGVLSQPLGFPFVAAVVDAGHNRAANVPVTFTVKQGDGNLAGVTTQTVNTDSNGRAIAVLTLGTQVGNTNNVVEASFPNNPGFPAAFAASARAPGNPANTTISGVVLDNSNNPIPGVTIRLFQTNQGNNNNLPVQVGTPVQTTANGTFLIQPAPVGFFKLMADGTTASGSNSYPTLEYDLVTVAGNDNTVGMPIYLPSLDTTNKLCVDDTHGGTLNLPQVPGFSLTVLPGSATFPGGARSGCVSVTPVNGDKVPMSPGFGQQPRFIVTIQPVGTRFDPPAAMTLPNVDGLPAKAVTEMYSYDHDLGMFVAIGTGTVSADGSIIASNPGVGVLKAGWHCGGNTNSTGTAGTCPECQTCQGNQCISVADCQTCSTGMCSSGNCVAPSIGSIVFNMPSADGKPGSEISFVSTDDLSFQTQVTPQCASGQLNWQSSNTGPDGSLDPSTANAASYNAVANPPPAPNGRAASLTYTVTATLASNNQQFTITQDEIDRIRQQYIDMQKDSVPDRSEFINSGSSSKNNFQFSEIKSPDSAWAVFSIFENLESWRADYGGPLVINRGYSTPVHNAGIAGAARNSRHIYGDAADVASNQNTWDDLQQSAKNSGACTEPLSISGSGHVHGDWRGQCPPDW